MSLRVFEGDEVLERPQRIKGHRRSSILKSSDAVQDAASALAGKSPSRLALADMNGARQRSMGRRKSQARRVSFAPTDQLQSVKEYVADVREWSLQPLKISNASAAAVDDDRAETAAATPSSANTAARPVAQSQSSMLSLQGAIDDDDTCASISELNFSLTSRDDAWRPMALLSTPKAKANEDSTQGSQVGEKLNVSLGGLFSEHSEEGEAITGQGAAAEPQDADVSQSAHMMQETANSSVAAMDLSTTFNLTGAIEGLLQAAATQVQAEINGDASAAASDAPAVQELKKTRMAVLPSGVGLTLKRSSTDAPSPAQVRPESESDGKLVVDSMASLGDGDMDPTAEMEGTDPKEQYHDAPENSNDEIKGVAESAGEGSVAEGRHQLRKSIGGDDMDMDVTEDIGGVVAEMEAEEPQAQASALLPSEDAFAARRKARMSIAGGEMEMTEDIGGVIAEMNAQDEAQDETQASSPLPTEDVFAVRRKARMSIAGGEMELTEDIGGVVAEMKAQDGAQASSPLPTEDVFAVRRKARMSIAGGEMELTEDIGGVIAEMKAQGEAQASSPLPTEDVFTACRKARMSIAGGEMEMTEDVGGVIAEMKAQDEAALASSSATADESFTARRKARMSIAGGEMEMTENIGGLIEEMNAKASTPELSEAAFAARRKARMSIAGGEMDLTEDIGGLIEETKASTSAPSEAAFASRRKARMSIAGGEMDLTEDIGGLIEEINAEPAPSEAAFAARRKARMSIAGGEMDLTENIGGLIEEMNAESALSEAAFAARRKARMSIAGGEMDLTEDIGGLIEEMTAKTSSPAPSEAAFAARRKARMSIAGGDMDMTEDIGGLVADFRSETAEDTAAKDFATRRKVRMSLAGGDMDMTQAVGGLLMSSSGDQQGCTSGNSVFAALRKGRMSMAGGEMDVTEAIGGLVHEAASEETGTGTGSPGGAKSGFAELRKARMSVAGGEMDTTEAIGGIAEEEANATDDTTFDIGKAAALKRAHDSLASPQEAKRPKMNSPSEAGLDDTFTLGQSPGGDATSPRLPGSGKEDMLEDEACPEHLDDITLNFGGAESKMSTAAAAEPSPISFADFLNLTGVHFLDKLTSKRRTTALGPVPGVAPTTLTDICKQGFGMLQELRQYEWCCNHMVTLTELLKAEMNTWESEAAAENPALFQAVAGMSESELYPVNEDMSSLKEHCRSHAKFIWHQWRCKLESRITETLKEEKDSLAVDAEHLGSDLKKSDALLHDLMQAQVQMKEEIVKNSERRLDEAQVEALASGALKLSERRERAKALRERIMLARELAAQHAASLEEVTGIAAFATERSTRAESDLSRARDVATQHELSRSESMHATLLSVVPWRPVRIEAEQLEFECRVETGSSVQISLDLAPAGVASTTRPVSAVRIVPSGDASPEFQAMVLAADLSTTCLKADVRVCLAGLERSLRGIANRLKDVSRLSLLQPVSATFIDERLEVTASIVSYTRLCKLQVTLTTSVKAIYDAPQVAVKALQGDSALAEIVQAHLQTITPGPYAYCDLVHAARASLS